MTRILVYGTLRRDQRAHGALRGAKLIEDAVRVPGFDMYGLYGFPGIKENPNNKKGIVGEVYDVDDKTLVYLDYYEGYLPHNPGGSHYLRKEIVVNGELTNIYVYNHDTEEPIVKLIPSGDWINKGE